MKTQRPVLLAVALLLLGTGVFAAGFRLASTLCARHWITPADDLGWLRVEFGLGEAELARIRPLHEGYVPVCRVRCEQIAARKAELEALLQTDPAAADPVRRKLEEIALLRAHCQSAMLAHFHAVSQAMPPDAGRRYLRRMQDLTLGLHEQLERSMAPQSSAGHVHH